MLSQNDVLRQCPIWTFGHSKRPSMTKFNYTYVWFALQLFCMLVSDTCKTWSCHIVIITGASCLVWFKL